MKVEYDKEVDAEYIYLKNKIGKGEIEKTIALNDNIILDFNKEGKLVGIEILNASTVVPKQTLPKHTLTCKA